MGTSKQEDGDRKEPGWTLTLVFLVLLILTGVMFWAMRLVFSSL